MSAAGTISIGTSTDGHIVITVSDGGTTGHTFVRPPLARVYGAMLMALADQIDPPSPLTPSEQGKD